MERLITSRSFVQLYQLMTLVTVQLSFSDQRTVVVASYNIYQRCIIPFLKHELSWLRLEGDDRQIDCQLVVAWPRGQ